jgi:hypothetical protein
MTAPLLDTIRVEMVNPAELKPHPRNYRNHLPDQLNHIK